MSVEQENSLIEAFEKSVAEALRDFRNKKNISVNEFAKTSGVPEEYILFVESGSSDVTIGDMFWHVLKLGGNIKIEIQ